jgi:hypothetical protein
MREARGNGVGQSAVIALVQGATCRSMDRRYFPRLRADTPVSPDTTPVSRNTMPVCPDVTRVNTRDAGQPVSIEQRRAMAT